MGNYLKDSKTRHRCPRCSKVRSSRTTCFLSSGSACLSLFSICTSLRPALYLGEGSGGSQYPSRVGSHGFLTADDLDGNLLSGVCGFPTNNPSTYHIGEHAFAERRENLVVSAVELFTKDYRVVAFWIRSRVQRGRDESGSGRFLGAISDEIINPGAHLRERV